MDARDALRPTPFSPWYGSATSDEAVDVYGFAVPVFITDPASEYDAIRSRVAALDFSMLYKWDVRGGDAIAVADDVVSRHVATLGHRRIAYGVVVDADGHMVDDVTVVVLQPDHVRVIGGNPASEHHLRAAARGTDVTVTEIRDTLAVLSLQGPHSRGVLQRLTKTDLSNEAFPYYSFDPAVEVAGIPAHVNRMGFTAELGYEVMGTADRAHELWEAVFAAGADLGVQAAGAAALMMVRVEAGMVMGGLEYDETTSTFECRLGWTVDFSKPSFQGRGALLADRDVVRRRLVTVAVDADPASADGAPLTVGDEEVGRITMAVPSPILGGRTVALAIVDRDHQRPGTRMTAADGIPVEVVATPVHDPGRVRVRG